MRRVSGLLSLLLAGAASPLFAVPANLHVYVRKASNSSALASASVAVLNYGPNGPDAAHSRIYTADSDGHCAVLCDSGYACEVVATLQGYTPTLREQFNDPAHKHVNADGTLVPDGVALSGALPPSTTIYLDNTDTARVNSLGEIDLTLANTTSGGLVFGDVRPNSSASDVSLAFGMAQAVGTDAALRIFNVPFASTNSYKAGSFDPGLGKGVDTVVSNDLSSGNPLRAYALDFASGMPPAMVANQTQQGSGNGLSVDGMVKDASDSSAVPYMGINFTYVRNDPYCQNCFDNRWINTDENGRFQLYGLQSQTSYYVTLNAGCNWRTGTCYQGFQSTVTSFSQYSYTLNSATNSVLTAGIDFFYASTSTLLTMQLRNPRAAGGANNIVVIVHDQFGNPLPQSNVNINPDQRSWQTTGGVCTTPGPGWASNPGLANINQQATTGYALLKGLPEGNYLVNIWTQFSQNQGTSFNANNNPTGSHTDSQGNIWDSTYLCPSLNWRLTLDTDKHLKVFSSSGTLLWDLGDASANEAVLVATVTVPTDNTGLVQGSITFPPGTTPDLTNDPINITIQPQCDSSGCRGQGGYAAISGQLAENTTSYHIHASSGAVYWMNVTSKYWGLVREGGGNNQVALTSTGAATVNFKFARSGSVMGKLLKPDGSIFTPTSSGQNNVQPNVSADGNNSYGWGQVNADGTYLVGGLLPGQYPLHVKAWLSGSGTFDYTDSSPMPNVTVISQQDIYKDVSLVKGVAVRMIVDMTKLPNMTVSACVGASNNWDCPPQNWAVRTLPAGGLFNEDKLSGLLLKGGSDDTSEFRFLPLTTPDNRDNMSSRVCHDGNYVGPAFCVNRVASPSNFDMYLMRKGGMDPSTGVRPYFTIISSTRNIVVDDNDKGNPALFNTHYVWGSSTLTVREVTLTPATDMHALSGTKLTGRLAGNSIFRQADFQSLGGSFDNFMKYIPMLTLYDSNSSLKAAGAAIPSPSCFNSDTVYKGKTMTVDSALNISIAEGDWAEFQSLFFDASSPCSGANSWGFDIRGLEANANYTAVLTTPNYPPYQFQVAMGADGSINALAVIDLDSVVGVGGTINGIVVDTTTAHNPIPDATVILSAAGLKQKTFSSVDSGTFTAVGLADGTYRLTAAAPGYAQQAQSQAISRGNTVSVSLALPRADASISGTVYAQKIPYAKLLPNAMILARLEKDPSYAGDLAVYKTYTSSVGVYQLDGLEAGKMYRFYVKAPGMMIMSATTVTISGVIAGMDFTPTPKPLTVEMYGRPNGTHPLGTYDFTLLNPNDFDTGSADALVSLSPFDVAHTTSVKNNFQQLPNNQVLLQYPLASLDPTKDYILRLKAYSILDRSKQVTKDIAFGVNRNAGAELSIDEALLGDDTLDDRGHSGNDALLDYSGSNASAVTVPPGSLVPISSAAVPTLSFSAVAPVNSTQAALVGNNAAFASDVYQIQLASANYGTDRGLDITLAYDKTNSDPNDLAIYHQDAQTGAWENLATKGFTQIIDPVKSTITVKKLKSLASVLRVRGDLKARWTAKGLAPSAALRPAGLRPDDVGVFGVLKPSVVSNNYTGPSVKVFNFPNPFSLDSKTRNIATGSLAGTAVTTNGTIIKVEVPAGVAGGHGTIRIYNLAGQLVREIDLGDNITGGNYYYSGWDGKNKSGADVANGVYYGILNLPGIKPKDGTFKMVVIK